MAQPPAQSLGRVTKVVVATSVASTFISFWRGLYRPERPGLLGIHVGGIAEQAIGRAAPWFILGVMLFSYAVRRCTWNRARCSHAAVLSRRQGSDGGHPR